MTVQDTQLQAVKVWADVGGTFTDCIVSTADQRRETKVLSSGLVRAAVAGQLSNDALKLDALLASGTEDFWTGAVAYWLDPQGGRQRLGAVRGHNGHTLFIDGDLARLQPESRQVIEIDASLEAPVLATRLLLGVPLSESMPPLDVRLGTTRGTNALLTRRGAATALLVTQGFADLLRIGEQDRPDLFSLDIEKTTPLTETVVEVCERLDAHGRVLRAIDTAALRQSLSELKAQGIESLAVCLMHAHVNDTHEKTAVQIAQELGFVDISRSSEVVPLIKMVSRAETTTLDAYLNPILARYVDRVWQQFGGAESCRLRLMTSNGNLVAPSSFRGRDSILSGPAGGVVGLGHVAALAGSASAVGLDMGGTSTDVSRYTGHVGRRYESRVAGIRVMTPMMDIETVAAGGGSICDYTDDHRLIVGPASAGADPGPACYGRGGPLTVTDVNLLLGRIPQSRFPFPLDRNASQRRLIEIRQRFGLDQSLPSVEGLAEGFLNIAVTHMAEAVRTVSTARGTDVREMALVGFGGAAGQHLCRVADAIGIRRILDHPDAGMLSALGIGLAQVGRVVTRGIYNMVDPTTVQTLQRVATELSREADELLKDEHDGSARTRYRYECDVRYRGTESAIALPMEPTQNVAERFHEAHHRTFGYAQSTRDVELVSVRCEATLESVEKFEPAVLASTTPAESESIPLWHGSQWIDAVLVDRDHLQVGHTIDAPAIVVGKYSTLVVEPGWSGNVITEGIIELVPVTQQRDVGRAPAKGIAGKAADDPVLLEVVARRLQGIADAMGEVLRQTSISVNVKERRDFSCAVFRGDGSLVANAPHVPVHLGAMGHTVRHLMNTFPTMSPGDCYLSNDPFSGGSHLPDITAVTPVFCDIETSEGRPDFFVASRAHHAEIGGRTPGSMPPDATSLAEEGVVIRDFALVRSGNPHWDELRQLLSSGPYPSRCVEENVADITAQQSAGAYGATGIRELAGEYSRELIDALMSRLLDVAGDSMQRWIKTLPEQTLTFRDSLDDGTEIGVAIRRDGTRLIIDFCTGPVHPHCFNATPAIVTAVVLYVLRTVSGSDLPLCDGVLRDVEIRLTPGLLDPPLHDDPAKCAAVVAGNVETSQRVVDVLLGALGVAAASQGTMNNVLIGDESFGYYETIGGGSGATANHSGAHAVHTHMTNTRITDPEVVESRLPLRLREFSIRRGSGGRGKHPGGDGIIREFEFLKPLVVSLLTSRRTTAPYGAASGQPGSPGANIWISRGDPQPLPSTATIRVQAGDRLRIETPGGGGWGNV